MTPRTIPSNNTSTAPRGDPGLFHAGQFLAGVSGGRPTPEPLESHFRKACAAFTESLNPWYIGGLIQIVAENGRGDLLAEGMSHFRKALRVTVEKFGPESVKYLISVAEKNGLPDLSAEVRAACAGDGVATARLLPAEGP